MKFFERWRDFLFQFQKRVVSSEKNNAIVIKRFKNDEWGIECRNVYQSSGSYIEMMWKRALEAIEFQNRSFKKILVLGSGGGCVIHCMQNMLGSKRACTDIIGIDWDAMMLQMSMAVYGENFLEKRNLERLMNFVPIEKKSIYSSENVTLLPYDAQEYIKNTKDIFDFIIVDIFQNTHPAPCVYEDTFRDAVYAHLSSGGHLLFNCWRSQDALRDIWEKKFSLEKEIISFSNNLLSMTL